MVHVSGVTGTVVDGTPAPVANLPISISGTDLAQTGRTSGNGSFSVTINHDLKRPAFLFGDGLTYAKLAVPVTTAAPALSVTTYPLPASGAALAAGGRATSGPLTLDVPAGASVLIDTLTYDTPASQQLRAVSIPIAGQTLVLPPAMGFQMMVGVAPLGTSICPAATLTVANNPEWAAGAHVEVWGLETDVGQEWGRFGQWGKLADGAVSADRQTISAPIAVLETVALRLAP